MSTAMEVSWGEGSRVMAIETSGLCECAQGIFYMVCVVFWGCGMRWRDPCVVHTQGCSLVVQ